MVDFPGTATIVETQNLTLSFLGAGGDRSTTGLSDIDPSFVNFDPLRTAIADASNAALAGVSLQQTQRVGLSQLNPLDESYSGVGDKLLMVFQNDALNEVTVTIPAPDESLFGADGITVITPAATAPADTPSQAIIRELRIQILAALNATTPTTNYTFLRGFRSRQGGKVPRPRTVRASVEPGAGILPPDAPGV